MIGVREVRDRRRRRRRRLILRARGANNIT